MPIYFLPWCCLLIFLCCCHCGDVYVSSKLSTNKRLPHRFTSSWGHGLCDEVQPWCKNIGATEVPKCWLGFIVDPEIFMAYEINCNNLLTSNWVLDWNLLYRNYDNLIKYLLEIVVSCGVCSVVSSERLEFLGTVPYRTFLQVTYPSPQPALSTNVARQHQAGWTISLHVAGLKELPVLGKKLTLRCQPLLNTKNGMLGM